MSDEDVPKLTAIRKGMSAKEGQADMLEALEKLRLAVLAGNVVAFSAVSIDVDDEVTAWVATSRSSRVSRLRMIGAISVLKEAYTNGEL